MIKYRCSCDAPFQTAKAMVAHYRKAHPDDAYGCYDQIGDIGDSFANKAIEKLRAELHEAEGKARQYRALQEQCNLLVQRFQVVRELMNMQLGKP